MLTFGTFLEHAASQLEKRTDGNSVLPFVPPLLESHIFWLGDDQEFQKHVHEIRADLMPEMKERIHLPFGDTTTVSVVNIPKWGKPIWTLDRLIENPPYLKEMVERKELGLLEGQMFLVIRYQLLDQVPLLEDPIMTWVLVYKGIDGNDVHFNFIPSKGLHAALESNLGNPSDEKWTQMQTESKVILDYAAALSHPENYVVQVTPELTPKEERKIAAGRPRPAQKARHFIVVDHEVLVRMRGSQGGTHASPVQHERRGHWRRLAERCRHAKLLGKDRVFVRPALVGDPAWKGEKNFYEVMPDLNRSVV